MPELPEVECLTKSIRSVATGGKISKLKFYRKDLREPIPIKEFKAVIKGERIVEIGRRSKYMLMHTAKGTGIFHLGMSGNILYYDTNRPQHLHTHAIFKLDLPDADKSGYLHFVDPRRFGNIGCHTGSDWQSHRYFSQLGPEPLEHKGLGEHLFINSRGRTVSIKSFIMNAHIVVGVGNIYANEALYKSKINPFARAGSLGQSEYRVLARKIRDTLKKAIAQGGTTLKDFKNHKGEPGYFKVALQAYGRAGKTCNICREYIVEERQSGRATFYCPACQPTSPR